MALPFPLRDVGKLFGIFMVCIGSVGWGSGFYFANPIWLAAGHPVIHLLGRLAVILGPVFVISGVVLYLFFSYGDIEGHEEVGDEPMRRLAGRRKAVVALMLLSLAVAGAYGVAASYMQPQFALVDVRLVNANSNGAGCWGMQSVGASYTVVNYGPVAGYATVRVSGGTYVIGEQTYYAPAGGSVTGEISGSVPCSTAFETVAAIVAIRGS